MADIEFRRFRQNKVNLSKILCLYGSDNEILTESTRQICQVITKSSSLQYETTRISSDQLIKEASLLIDFFSGISLFGEHRILVVEGISERHITLFNNLLASNIPPDNFDYLVIASSSLKRKSKLLEIFRNHPCCTVISSYDNKIEPLELRSLIKDNGIRNLSDSVINSLEEIAQSQTYNETVELIKKISLLSKDTAITDNTLYELLPEDFQSAHTGHLEALFSGNPQWAQQTLTHHLKDVTDPSALSAIINRQLIDIISILSGQNKVANFRMQKIISSHQHKVPNFISRIEAAIIELHLFDIKSRKNNTSSIMELERCFIRISHLFASAYK